MPEHWITQSHRLWPAPAAWDDAADDLFCIFAVPSRHDAEIRLNVLDAAGEYLLHIVFHPAAGTCLVSRTNEGVWQGPFEFPLDCFRDFGQFNVHVRWTRRQARVLVTAAQDGAPRLVAQFAVPARATDAPCRVELSQGVHLKAARFTRAPMQIGDLAAPGSSGGQTPLVVLTHATSPAAIAALAPALLAVFEDLAVAAPAADVQRLSTELPFPVVPISGGLPDLATLDTSGGCVLWDARFIPHSAGLLRLREHHHLLVSGEAWATVFPLASPGGPVAGLAVTSAVVPFLQSLHGRCWFAPDLVGKGHVTMLEGAPIGHWRAAEVSTTRAAPEAEADWAAMASAIGDRLGQRDLHGADHEIHLLAWPVPQVRLLCIGDTLAAATARASLIAAHCGIGCTPAIARNGAALARLLLRHAPPHDLAVLVLVPDSPPADGEPAGLVLDQTGLAQAVAALSRKRNSDRRPALDALYRQAILTTAGFACLLAVDAATDPLLHSVMAFLATLPAPPSAGSPDASPPPPLLAATPSKAAWNPQLGAALGRQHHRLVPAHAALLLEDARQALDEHDVADAHRLALAAWTMAPRIFEAGLATLANAYIDTGHRDALAHVLAALPGPGATLDRRLATDMSRTLLGLRLLREALDMGAPANAQPPPDALAENMVYAAYELGDVATQARLVAQLTERDPGSIAAQTQLAHLDFRHHQWAAAAVRYEKLLLKQPRDWLILSRLVQCHLHAGQLAKARTHLATLQQTTSDFADVPRLAGSLACAEGWDEAAREASTQAIIACEPSLAPVLRRDWQMQMIRPFAQPPGPTDVIAFFVVRNEAMRLPFVLDYYRQMGVRHFVVLDNGSTDKTRTILESADGCCVLRTDESYAASRCGVAWFNMLMDRFGRDHWCLCLDADELLVFPHADRIDIPTLCAWLDSAGAEGLPSLLLDMYAPGPLRKVVYQPGEDLRACFDHFDATPYSRWPIAGSPRLALTGGLRDRIFRLGRFAENPALALQKVPLVKWRRGIQYLASTHEVTPLRLANLSACLLHFKYLPDFHARAVEETRRGEHWGGASEYRMYAHLLARQPDLSLHGPSSRRYDGPEDLVQAGLMSSTDEFDTWCAARAGAAQPRRRTSTAKPPAHPVPPLAAAAGDD